MRGRRHIHHEGSIAWNPLTLQKTLPRNGPLSTSLPGRNLTAHSQSAQESFSNHCESHSVARKAKHISLALACKEQFVDWETLKRNDFTARVEKCFETLRMLKNLLGTPCSCSLGDPSMRGHHRPRKHPVPAQWHLRHCSISRSTPRWAHDHFPKWP